MIIAPFHTDAPIYYRPVGTVVLIVVNVVVFLMTMFQVRLGNVEIESVEWLILQFDTINPLQWLTSAFMHADLIHLISNMLFLWAFGLVVEGKIGSARFAIVYVALAMLQGAMVQLTMFVLGGESGALGASGAIFSLMVITVLWAPENEMECFYWLGFIFWGTFQVRIFVIGLVFISLQLLMLFLNDFSMSSAMLHMAGVVVGIPVGVFMLRNDLVDCEGWDLISRTPALQKFPILFSEKQNAQLRKTKAMEEPIGDPIAAALALGHGNPDPRFPGAQSAKPATQPANQNRAGSATSSSRSAAVKSRQSTRRHAANTTNATASEAAQAELPQVAKAKSDHQFNGLAYVLRQSIQSSNAAASQQAFLKMDQQKLAVGLSDKVLFAYVTLLGKRKQYVDALRPLQIVALRKGPHAEDAMLRIAQIHLKVLNNPAAAIRVLKSFEPLSQASSPAQQAKYSKRNELLAAAQRMI